MGMLLVMIAVQMFLNGLKLFLARSRGSRRLITRVLSFASSRRRSRLSARYVMG